MDKQVINPAILEDMVAAEIAMKYGVHSQALEILNRISRGHPNYLPAKEALEAVYRERGEIELAGQVAREIEQIRSHLASEAASKTNIAGQEQIRKRQFIAGVDSIVREIYDTREEEEVLKVSASKLAASIHADRCLMVVREKDGLKARSFEFCNAGVAPSLDSRTAKLTFLISKLVAETPDPIVIAEPMTEPALAECQPVLQSLSIRSILACALLYKNDRIGVVVAHRCHERAEWAQEEVTLLSTLAGHAAVALKNAQHFREAQGLQVKEELTGLHSRNFFEQRLSVELRNAQQQGYPLCLATLSVDDFEKLREVQGQAVSAIVLHKVGFLLKTHLRKGCVVARSAEDQFIVILPNASESVSHQIMAQLKSVIERNLKTDSGHSITVSVGVTETNAPSSHSTPLEQPRVNVSQDQEGVTFKGDLSDVGMQDIVQILESGRKCGQLVIDAAGKAGSIYFNSGRIVNAAFQDKVGEPALFDLLAVGGAKFEYRPSQIPYPEVINSSNTHLLLEGLRLLDEANRNHPEAAQQSRTTFDSKRPPLHKGRPQGGLEAPVGCPPIS